jgi:hypothetical protein
MGAVGLYQNHPPEADVIGVPVASVGKDNRTLKKVHLALSPRCLPHYPFYKAKTIYQE